MGMMCYCGGYLAYGWLPSHNESHLVVASGSEKRQLLGGSSFTSQNKMPGPHPALSLWSQPQPELPTRAA